MRKNNYYSVVICAILLFGFTHSTRATEGNNGWSAKYENQKVFIENKGQFHIYNSKEPVLYAYDDGSTMIYFTAKGVTYSFLKRWKKDEKENERELERKNSKSGKSHAEMEAEERKMEFKTDVVSFNWENANSNVEIIPEEASSSYFSYNTNEKGSSEKNTNNINAFKKIIYKNIYPNIDIEYVFHPTEGIKYSIILHPGADISKVKMLYDEAAKLKVNGDLHISTLFGDIVDHTPVTFYSDNKSEIISSHFIKTDKTISFDLGAYDHSKTLIIDPWVQTPTLSNSNSVWECERDGSGNVYIIGGDSPMKLIKYNTTGTLQWTYNTTWDTANYWLGTFAVDLAGNSYVTSGTSSKISKVNTAGSNVWTNNNIGGSSQELWNISFNCDQTHLIIGGTSGIFTLRGSIFDLDVTNGNVVTNKIVGYNKPLMMGINAPDEVRSICSAQNGKYYFLILDSIGRISQNFTSCSSNASLYKTTSTYDFAYYNPSYRYDNAGIMAIKANKNFLYTQNGNTLHKRSLNTLAILSTVTIPGGINVAGAYGNPGRVPGSSGLDIDSCGNVYVGSSSGIYKYDANLTQIGFVSLPFTVFDVAVSTAGNVIAAGSTTQTSGTRTGYVQSIASFTACNPMTLFCCNATICPVASMCLNASPIALSGGTPGGTWSGAGVNSSTGVFTPTTAGTGTHVIIYTLPCGSDSITITVNDCATLFACQEQNGTITVSGGTGPYTWYKDSTYQDCSACFIGCTFPAGCAVNTTVSTIFATGTTITPPGTYPIHVTDGSSNTLVITSFASLTECSHTCPTLTVTPSNIVNDSCFGQSTGSFNASTIGGASPWDYVLKNSSGTTVASFTNIAGTQSFTGLPAGTYTLNVMDTNNCPGSTTIIISQPSGATTVAAAGPDQSMCSNSAILAGNTPTVGNGMWTLISGSGTITTPTSPTSGITGLGLGANVFQWAINNSPCSSTTDQVTITNTGGGPTVTIPTHTNIACYGGNSGSATASATGGIGNISYSWAPSGGNAATAHNLTAGTYTVTVVDSMGCTGFATIPISQSDSIHAHITTTPTACGTTTGSATIAASGGTGGLTYSWSSGGATTAAITNIGAGVHTVTVTDSLGCTKIISGTVGITGALTVNTSSQTNVFCYGGNTGSATVSVNGSSGSLTYVWATSGGTAAAAHNLTAGSYTVTVTDGSGCVGTKTISITQSDSISAHVNTTPTGCGSNNGSASVTAQGGAGHYTYSWNGGGTAATINNIGAGSHTVTVTDSLGCTKTASGTVATTAGPTANAGNDVTISADSSTHLSATGGGTYSWSPSTGLSCTNCQNPIASPAATTTYYVTVKDSNECTSTDTVIVTVKPYYFIPNIFSPNNDGVNDLFELKADGYKTYHVEIFDRWGLKMFESTDSKVFWNGHTMSGGLASNGVYFYLFSIGDFNDQQQTFKGALSLVR